MSGYTRFWTCEGCGSREQSVDMPRVLLCDSCEFKRAYAEHRADGWPMCPRCGEDELWSAAIPATVGTIVSCLRCNWRPLRLDVKEARMPIFRKKPVVIEAMQWAGGAAAATPVIDWILSTGERSARWDDPEEDGDGRGVIAIDTLEGTMCASPGDWIIRGVKGEFYPCKPDIFEATYDAA